MLVGHCCRIKHLRHRPAKNDAAPLTHGGVDQVKVPIVVHVNALYDLHIPHILEVGTKLHRSLQSPAASIGSGVARAVEDTLAAVASVIFWIDGHDDVGPAVAVDILDLDGLCVQRWHNGGADHDGSRVSKSGRSLRSSAAKVEL